MSREEREIWDEHWKNLSRSESFFGRMSSAVRRLILSRAVRSYVTRYFAREGLFMEMGCGTAESSGRIAAGRRRLFALDFSQPALRAARRVPSLSGFVQGDITRLAIRGGALSGVWNLGVMEHFSEEDGLAILREFWRALAPGGIALLFWPPEFGSSRLVLGPVERFLSWRRRARFAFFPDEVNRVRSRAHARRLVTSAGFEALAVEFSPRDLFIHAVVVARKPAA